MKLVLKNNPRKYGLVLFSFCLFAIIGCSNSEEEKVEADTVELSARRSTAKVAPQTIQQLESLGYFDRALTSNPKKLSVTRSSPKAFDGLNLYSSRHRAEAYLIDNSGKVMHKWSAETEHPTWMHIELQPNGDLLALSKLAYLAKYDWKSKIIWRREMSAHHDLAKRSDGSFLVLSSMIREIDYDGAEIPILDNSIATITKKGKLRRDRALSPILLDFIPEHRLERIKRRFAKGYKGRDIYQENGRADVFHTNSIQIIHESIPSVAEAGSLLLSVRELSRIFIVDQDVSRVLWSWGEGELEEQHHATLLDNGNIMIFDNGIHRKQSRVIEVNPVSGEIEWSYTAPDFFTDLRGSAQKLDNGNVLITESDKGHAFEITPAGKMVWEFWNPDVIEDGDKVTRGVIYRMTRYKKDYLDDGLLDG